MQDAASRAKPALPYGIFLTLVSKDFGISLEGEPSRKLQHFDPYNEKSLRWIGYTKTDNHWIKKGEEREEEEERERERVEPMEQQDHCTSLA